MHVRGKQETARNRIKIAYSERLVLLLLLEVAGGLRSQVWQMISKIESDLMQCYKPVLLPGGGIFWCECS